MNYSIFLYLHNIATQSPLLEIVAIFCARWLPWIVVGTVIIIIFRSVVVRNHLSFSFLGRWFHEIISIMITLGIALGITTALKYLIKLPRPFLTFEIDPALIYGGYDSFPSGHATIFFALAGIIAYYEKSTRWFFLLCAIIIGIARIMVGIHYPADIVVGAGIGFGVSWLVHRYIKNRVSTTFLSRNR